jgi:hypothetical protein
MKTRLLRLAAVLGAVSAWFTVSTGTVFAHTGEDASSSHIIEEFGLWALGVVAALAVLVLVFWIRARLRRESAA